MPDALRVKFPNADRSWQWQFVFPAARICRDPRIGEPTQYHLHESVIQRAVSEGVRRAGISKRASCHTCVTDSQLTCWRTATTSELSRSCSATPT
jgi:hypothetical protein